jgi:ribonuclease P protein component
MKPFSFPKNERLLNRKDFVNLNRFGKRYHGKHFTLILRKNTLTVKRLGITVGKKVGNSVKRNKVKRLIREFFRLNKNHFPDSCDIVVIAKTGAVDLVFRKVEKELREIILDKKIHL